MDKFNTNQMVMQVGYPAIDGQKCHLTGEINCEFACVAAFDFMCCIDDKQ